ncbi:unnamed protein product [Dovyalis caffra]|uniref:Alpha/beta hydrolase fold-3 domain-containing protein n=1 Tax=Dovyalis caffra TaxID=77055 RepID=A0AAV1S200_9ROSI|nr:unnamed protein product [Dovyalis caffra]
MAFLFSSSITFHSLMALKFRLFYACSVAHPGFIIAIVFAVNFNTSSNQISSICSRAFYQITNTCLSCTYLAEISFSLLKKTGISDLKVYRSSNFCDRIECPFTLGLESMDNYTSASTWCILCFAAVILVLDPCGAPFNNLTRTTIMPDFHISGESGHEPTRSYYRWLIKKSNFWLGIPAEKFAQKMRYGDSAEELKRDFRTTTGMTNNPFYTTHYMGRSGMAAFYSNPRIDLQDCKKTHGVSVKVEEIEGLIRVYKDGHIERPLIIPNVPCTLKAETGVAADDVVIDKFTNLWARIYIPSSPGKLPFLVYHHGGGFCVGSAAWSCYHEFLAHLASKAGCMIMSINYRLAPENRLPAAYDDGINALKWVKQQALNGPLKHKWWLSRCDFSRLFLAGDSAGANIAYNVAAWVGSKNHPESILKPLYLKGIILIQPFFGGEARTSSEKNTILPANSALTLPTSDTFWRLSLPLGANRNHPYCNPLANGATNLHNLQLPATMVCISEMDILKDRNLEFCTALVSAGKRVETVLHKGVGHAFQVLHNSQVSQTRTQEMISQIKSFIINK